MPTFLVGLPPIQCRSATSNMFLFEFLRVSGEGRLISDLSVQRRHAVQQRVACRLANISAPPATRSSSKGTLPPSSSPATILIAENEQHLQTTNDIVKHGNTLATITEEKIAFDSNNEEGYDHETNEKIDMVDEVSELKTFNGIQKSNSAMLHERIVEQMIESSVLNVPLPMGQVNYDYKTVSDLPKCLIANNGGKFD